MELWNQHDSAGDGIARTTNAVEGWHYGLQSLFQCAHPTMWKFIDGVFTDMGNQRFSFMQGIAGIQLPPVRKYQVVKENLRRVVERFGDIEILTYLKAVQYLSCK